MSATPPALLARLEGKQGAMVVSRLKPGYVLITVKGYDDGELLERLYQILDEEIDAAGGGATFIDSRLETGTSPEARDTSARWAKKKGAKLHSSNLLFKSKVLELVVAVANLAVGGNTRAFSDVNSFEQAIAREVPGFTHLPDFDE
jgi:hypothetical protein